MITLYRDTIEKAAKESDGCTDADKEIVDDMIEYYLDFIKEKLSAEFGADHVMVTDGQGFGPLHHSTGRNEREALADLPSFWEWYN